MMLISKKKSWSVKFINFKFTRYAQFLFIFFVSMTITAPLTPLSPTPSLPNPRIGRSWGRRGHTPPISAQIFLFSCTFWRKLAKPQDGASILEWKIFYNCPSPVDRSCAVPPPYHAQPPPPLPPQALLSVTQSDDGNFLSHEPNRRGIFCRLIKRRGSNDVITRACVTTINGHERRRREKHLNQVCKKLK